MMWDSAYIVTKRWHKKVLRALYLVDLAAIIISVASAHLIRFGFEQVDLPPINLWPFNLMGKDFIPFNYLTLDAVMVILWWVTLQFTGARSVRVLGFGPEEYRLVTRGTCYFFCIIIIAAFFLKVEFTRVYLLISYPLGLLGLLLGRWGLRKVLIFYRKKGRALTRILILSDASTGRHLHKTLTGAIASGLFPAAHYLPGLPEGTVLGDNLPVLGYSTNPDDIMQAVRENNIHMVAVSDGHHLSPSQLRMLGWKLSDARIALIMAPATTDIAGPRMHIQPLNGIPLVHVSTPRITGAGAAAKRSIDIISSALGLILLSPIFAVVALLVKRDGGPVLFFQERVGLNGRPFKMVKFRSMRVDAEEIKKELMSQNEGHGLLFKMAKDPRVTPIGRFIRKFSIDELPQLWNVFRGDMSLVGPRPPLTEEVEKYEQIVYRRLLVKPGITGLWQVSGRSNLSWEESVRLDLYYVENWSLTTDLMILVRTFRAVFSKNGAY